MGERRMSHCKYCGNHIDLEDWLQRMYPNVCHTCLIDGTHKGRQRVSLAQILREDKRRDSE